MSERDSFFRIGDRFLWNGVVVVFGVAVPVILILLGGGRLNMQTTIALSAGASAFSLMAINLFLATRPPFLERWIGGLDRLYVTHKWTGIAVLFLIIAHERIGMRFDQDQMATVGLAALAKKVGQTAFYVLLVLLAISWMKRWPRAIRRYMPWPGKGDGDLLPYGLWRWTHRALGLVFMALAFHQLFVRVPYDANALVSGYLNTMAALGIVSYLYTQVGALLRRRRYTVTEVTAHPAATIIQAAPVRRPITPRPGAFAVISVGRSGLREPHPFTISGAASQGQLQFSIRALGDYTRRLRDRLKVGDTLYVEGGYGTFDYRKGRDTQLWLAGGIGITPFLSFADSLTAQETRRITLVYAVSDPQEAVGLDRLDAAARRCPHFTYYLHASKADGRLTAKHLAGYAPFAISKADLWFCGPAPLRTAILSQLRKEGNAPRGVHFEQFEFR